ncbi:MAG TPA: hypothetical protein VE153_12135 [Myxococcus sp.]|jgi:hypothetical protein|nr:hypothetical protein [Myxococcus sp.]
MTFPMTAEQQLQDARRELTAAEQGLSAGTEAARVRYARALHEADIAERRAERQARERNRQHRSWWLAVG